jgi:hypothetical protein
MASVLTINQTRPSGISVNLLDPNGLYLKQDGWEPAVGQPDDHGDIEDVVEVITCTWMLLNDNDRAPVLEALGNLDQDARRHWNDFHRRYPVYLAASTHTETNTHYATVKRILIDNLHSRHWGPAQPSELIITIVHAGWRRVLPQEYSIGSFLAVDVRVRNHVVSTNNNWITLEPPSSGHTGLLRLTMKPDLDHVAERYPNNYIIGMKTGELSDLNNFNPHFNPVDGNSSASTISDSNAPGGQSWSISAPSVPTSFGADWEIDANYYVGRYAVYAVAHQTGGGVTLRVWQGSTKIRNADYLVPESLSSPARFLPVYLGTISIPWFGNVNNETLPADYLVGLTGHIPVGSTLFLRNWFLVPIDEQHTAVNTIVPTGDTFGSQTVVMDGDLERSYVGWFVGEASVWTLLSYYEIEVNGQYLTLPATGPRCRLYFYNTHNVMASFDQVTEREFSMHSDFEVSVQYIRRFGALRGSL